MQRIEHLEAPINQIETVLQFCKDDNRIYSSVGIKRFIKFQRTKILSCSVGKESFFCWMSSENREANFIKLDRPSSQKPEKT